uniref:Flavin-containing monooxygenase n=1 Tax=Aegilops tauschii subsp. strangulata TaxID=200361 RepID=A0A453IXN8_AEGTS
GHGARTRGAGHQGGRASGVPCGHHRRRDQRPGRGEADGGLRPRRVRGDAVRRRGVEALRLPHHAAADAPPGLRVLRLLLEEPRRPFVPDPHGDRRLPRGLRRRVRPLALHLVRLQGGGHQVPRRRRGRVHRAVERNRQGSAPRQAHVGGRHRHRRLQHHSVLQVRVRGVMCTGKYGDVPRMPVFPPGKGPEVFKGTVMHSLDYCKLSEEETVELMRGKKVVVVGYKKSAIDLANECAQANQVKGGQPCTMLVRTLHWVVPSYSIWGLPFSMFYSTRLSQLFYERPNQGFFRSLLCRLMSPLRAGVSKFIESYLSWKL